MKEADLQRKMRAMLEQRGAKVIKQHGDVYSEIGVSDLLVCYRGHFVAIETKMPGKKPTQMQERFLEEVRAAGGEAFVFVGKDGWTLPFRDWMANFERAHP